MPAAQTRAEDDELVRRENLQGVDLERWSRDDLVFIDDNRPDGLAVVNGTVPVSKRAPGNKDMLGRLLVVVVASNEARAVRLDDGDMVDVGLVKRRRRFVLGRRMSRFRFCDAPLSFLVGIQELDAWIDRQQRHAESIREVPRGDDRVHPIVAGQHFISDDRDAGAWGELANLAG